jgi:hypothetical protein
MQGSQILGCSCIVVCLPPIQNSTYSTYLLIVASQRPTQPYSPSPILSLHTIPSSSVAQPRLCGSAANQSTLPDRCPYLISTCLCVLRTVCYLLYTASTTPAPPLLHFAHSHVQRIVEWLHTASTSPTQSHHPHTCRLLCLCPWQVVSWPLRAASECTQRGIRQDKPRRDGTGRD